jgi:hypothetical protein
VLALIQAFAIFFVIQGLVLAAIYAVLLAPRRRKTRRWTASPLVPPRLRYVAGLLDGPAHLSSYFGTMHGRLAQSAHNLDDLAQALGEREARFRGASIAEARRPAASAAVMPGQRRRPMSRPGDLRVGGDDRFAA